MDRKNFYWKQKVTWENLRDAFNDVESALADFLAGFQYAGITLGAETLQQVSPNLTVRVTGPAVIYDADYRHIAWDATQIVNCALDENGVATAVSTVANSKWISIFAEYRTETSDPRIDGNGDTIYYVENESFRLNVVQGSQAVSNPARPLLRADQVLIADILLIYGQTAIVTADIDTSRTQLVYDLPGSPLEIRSRSLLDVLQAMLDVINAHTGATISTTGVVGSIFSTVTSSIDAAFASVIGYINTGLAHLAQPNVFTKKQTATGATTDPGFVGTGGPGGAPGMTATGTGGAVGFTAEGGPTGGTGHGIVATGGASADGIHGVASSGNGYGVLGTGSGNNAGVRGDGGTGTTAAGVRGLGGSSGGIGVRGTGGSTTGRGVVGYSSGTGTAVYGDGAGEDGTKTGIGVAGIGGAGKAGADFIGGEAATGIKATGGANGGSGGGLGADITGGPAATGLVATGGSGNTTGVSGVGKGTGYGVQAVAQSATNGGGLDAQAYGTAPAARAKNSGSGPAITGLANSVVNPSEDTTYVGVYGEGVRGGYLVATGNGDGAWCHAKGSGSGIIAMNTGSGAALRCSVSGGTGPAIHLVPQSDPASPSDGDIWYDGAVLKIRLAGVTRTIALV
jgi:hypothetical protein